MRFQSRSLEELIGDHIRNRAPGPGFTIQNADGDKATLRIYDIIGWPFIEAESIASELDAITANEIEVQISSPGGDVFEGVAIYNALRSHPATVTTRVDSMAASIASVIAQAGDRRVMLTGSQMMIHEAWGIAIGNAGDMRDLAKILDKQTDIIADIYAERADGDAGEFRALMVDESWFDAAETVEAGLADEVVKPAAENRVPSKFAAEAASLVGEIEAFAEETENVVAFRSQQGKAPLSDEASEQVERLRDALARIDVVASPEQTQTEDQSTDFDLELAQARLEWEGRRYKEVS